METTKFGWKQLKNETPKWMSDIANGIIFATMVWGLISMGISSISPEVKASINEWVLVASGIIKLATKFFGITVKQ